MKLVVPASGRDALALYVRGGQVLEVEVPLGSYRMRYASGEIWRGTAHLFGPAALTRYNEANSVLHFHSEGDRVSGYTVELIPQAHGNLRVRSLTPSEF